ncbi:hypothetical protein HanRHA438_Chr15g0714901 [Helianthus annuus]|nr:hypothetical protein HanRHA438_Chr15g0714901 [Helianthus annuus]
MDLRYGLRSLVKNFNKFGFGNRSIKVFPPTGCTLILAMVRSLTFLGFGCGEFPSMASLPGDIFKRYKIENNVYLIGMRAFLC